MGKSYDVAVAGGGIAGIAAALAARRSGAGRVLLAEREYALGGLATLGLIAIYLPLCDGCGTQVSYGIAEELLRLAVSRGCKDALPDAWLNRTSGEHAEKSGRFQARYDPNVFAVLAEQLLLDSGVELLYGTAVCGADTDGTELRALQVESHGTQRTIEAGVLIDATGDADVCAAAGAPTREFAPKNALAAWYFAQEKGTLILHTLGAADEPDDGTPKRHVPPLDKRRWGGIDPEEVTKSVCAAHRILLNDFLKSGPVGPDHSLASIAAIPQLRMTRCLVGACTADGSQATDCIGRIGNWRRSGPVYEIPFRSLYSPAVANLLVAGRCISVTDEFWDQTRVIPACAVTGQAAGTAAALGRDIPGICAARLQECLRRDGVRC